MTIQKNLDGTLAASHTMKLMFAVPQDSPLGNIKQISVLQMRREDNSTGESLKGIPVRVMENSFLVGLARGDAEASNLDLLRSREWLDVPMVLANGHIAKLTFEKGPSGQRALDDAMASWQAQRSKLKAPSAVEKAPAPSQTAPTKAFTPVGDNMKWFNDKILRHRDTLVTATPGVRALGMELSSLRA
jgi:hypothetical protein